MFSCRLCFAALLSEWKLESWVRWEFVEGIQAVDLPDCVCVQWYSQWSMLSSCEPQCAGNDCLANSASIYQQSGRQYFAAANNEWSSFTSTLETRIKQVFFTSFYWLILTVFTVRLQMHTHGLAVAFLSVRPSVHLSARLLNGLGENARNNLHNCRGWKM